MPINSENNVTRVSFIEHLLVIPKTPDPNGDEIYAALLDVQPRALELLERVDNSFTDKISAKK